MKNCGKCGVKFDGKRLFCDDCCTKIAEILTSAKADG
jgi:hypothetical protein